MVAAQPQRLVAVLLDLPPAGPRCRGTLTVTVCHRCVVKPGTIPLTVDRYERGPNRDEIVVVPTTIVYCQGCWIDLRAGVFYDRIGIVDPDKPATVA